MTRLGEYLPPDTNKDGVTDIADQQAEWRAQDQAESARAMRELTAAIGQGVRNLGAAFAGLWRNVLAIPAFFRRVRIVARVQIVAQSVGDAQALYDRLFLFPPVDPGHESYRRSFVALALEPNKTRAQWLVFADMLDGLQAFEDRPLDAWLVLRRPPKPELTAPRVEPASIQGFAGLPSPVGLFTPATQVLAALLVLAIMVGLWQRADNAALKSDAKENELRADAAEAANDGLAKRVVLAEDALEKVRIERDETRALADARMEQMQQAVERARAARNSKRVTDAQAETRPGGDLGDDREWLQRNVEPAGLASGDASGGPGTDAAANPGGVPQGPSN